MAKSTTKNELTEFDVEKIKRFTDTELNKLADRELPFCYQVGPDVVIVGRSKVIRININCWRVQENNQDIFDFFTRKDAIFYCIATHKKNHQLAKQIKDNDTLLGQLEFDAQLYRHRYKQAQAKQDDWMVDLYSNKYSEVMLRIEQTKKELKKSIDLTKYIKL